MNLKAIREEMGLTGAEFARRIGASPGQLHDWENGRQLLTVKAAAKIEKALDRPGFAAEVARERLRRDLENAA